MKVYYIRVLWWILKKRGYSWGDKIKDNWFDKLIFDLWGKA